MQISSFSFGSFGFVLSIYIVVCVGGGDMLCMYFVLCTLHIGFALSISVFSWSDHMHCVHFNCTLHFNFALISNSVFSWSDE